MMHRQETVECLKKFNARRKLKVCHIFTDTTFHGYGAVSGSNSQELFKENVEYKVIILYDHVMIIKLLKLQCHRCNRFDLMDCGREDELS